MTRWAIIAVFAANGITIASLAVRTPSLKLDYALSAGQLGLTAASFGVAAVLAMQVAGRLAARWGSATIVRVAAALLPLGLVGVGLARSLPELYLVMAVVGVTHGLLDVAMNAQAVAVERVRERPILNGCHAAWSLGAVAGSLVGGAAAQRGLSLAGHYGVLAGVLIPIALLAGAHLLPARVDAAPAAGSVRPRPGAAGRSRSGWPKAGWTGRLVVLGAMGATVLTVEAAVANWSGVLMHEHLGASLGVAALGYITFNACETAVRLIGDRLLVRCPAAVLIRVGTGVAAGGLALVVASRWTWLTIAGFALVGIGLATPLPVLFGVVGHEGAAGSGAATAVSRFATMTYAGILLGPALTGWLAQIIGLPGMLAVLIGPLALVAAWSGPVLTRGAPRSPKASTAPGLSRRRTGNQPA